MYTQSKNGIAVNQRRHVSSVRVGLANGTKRTPAQKWGNLLSELHVPHEQCLTGISDAFSGFFCFFVFYRYQSVFASGSLYKSVPTLRHTSKHLGFPKSVCNHNGVGRFPEFRTLKLRNYLEIMFTGQPLIMHLTRTSQ